MATRTKAPKASAPTVQPRELALPVPASDINAALSPPAPVAIPAPAPKLPPQYGVPRRADLPASPRKLWVLQALRDAGAVGGAGAPSKAVMLAGQGRISERDVRHYCYHAAVAVPAPLTTVTRGVGVGYLYSLTPAGEQYITQYAALLAAVPAPVVTAPPATAPQAPAPATAPVVTAPPASDAPPAKGKGRKASK